MALGQNVNLQDKLIKKTTNKKNKASIGDNTSKGNNEDIFKSLGQASLTPTTDTYATKKASFYIKEDLLRKFYNFAYWERHSVTEAINIILRDGLKGKTTKDKKQAK